MMKSIFRISVSLPILILIFSNSSAIAVDYTVSRLGHLGDGGSYAYDINNNGIAAGSSRGDAGGEIVDNATRWNIDGIATNLDNNQQSIYTFGRGINASGDVVGLFNDIFPNLWKEGGSIHLLSFDGSFLSGAANDINDAGTIVGCARNRGKLDSIPAKWTENFIAQPLPGIIPGMKGCATKINTQGHITGSVTLDGVTSAAIWRNNTMELLAHPTGFENCYANAINDFDNVVGFCRSLSTNTSVPILWQGSSVIQLELVSGETGVALDINNNNEILGYGGGPFVWRDGILQDLSSVVRPIKYRAINDKGQIVGNSYVLTPSSISIPTPDAPPSPEPTIETADLSISVINTPNPARRNRLLTYQLTVNNHGPSTARNVSVKNNLSKYVRLISINTTQGVCSGERNINCELGNLDANQTAIIEISTYPRKRRTLENKVSVESDTHDSDSTNNLAINKTRVKR